MPDVTKVTTTRDFALFNKVVFKSTTLYISTPYRRMFFHEKWFDPFLNLYFGQIGALVYVLEEKEGRPLSKGYHEYFIKDGNLFGRVGAREEQVALNPMEHRRNINGGNEHNPSEVY